MSITVWNAVTIGQPDKLCYLLVVNGLDPRPEGSSFVRPATLNMVGTIVLVLGIVIAGIVYWVGQARSASQAVSYADGDWHDDTLSLEDSKRSTYDVEMYGGSLEMLMVKINTALAQPGVQSTLIVVASALVASGCFVAARQPPPDHDVS
jgi:hypothetical protein